MVDKAGEASYVAAAEKQIDRLVSANKRQQAILAVAVVLVLLLGWIAWNQHQESLATCRTGNTYRMEDDQIWNYFIGVLAAGNNKPGVQAQVHSVENHIAQLDAPRTCSSAWSLFY